jgi:hypothetical protein
MKTSIILFQQDLQGMLAYLGELGRYLESVRTYLTKNTSLQEVPDSAIHYQAAILQDNLLEVQQNLEDVVINLDRATPPPTSGKMTSFLTTQWNSKRDKTRMLARVLLLTTHSVAKKLKERFPRGKGGTLVDSNTQTQILVEADPLQNINELQQDSPPIDFMNAAVAFLVVLGKRYGHHLTKLKAKFL